MYSQAVFLISLVASCHGFASGGLPAGCPTLAPVHTGAQPQVTDSPYSIVVTESEWTADGTLTVTISSSGAEINGFILQAKEQGTDTGIGKFEESSLPAGSQLGPCVDSNSDKISVTHTNPDAKGTSLEFKWLAPSSGFDGSIYFQGAVVQDHQTYWADLKSADIPMAKDAGEGGSTQAPAPSTEATVNVDPTVKTDATEKPTEGTDAPEGNDNKDKQEKTTPSNSAVVNAIMTLTILGICVFVQILM